MTIFNHNRFVLFNKMASTSQWPGLTRFHVWAAEADANYIARQSRNKQSSLKPRRVIINGMAYATDERVDAYIRTLPNWQQALAGTIRDLVHAADPAVTETIKRTRLPYFVLGGNICALLGTKDHLNLFIYDPIAPDPHRLINQGEGNATARAIQLHEGDAVNKPALLELFKAVIVNNRAGGWRKLTRKD